MYTGWYRARVGYPGCTVLPPPLMPHTDHAGLLAAVGCEDSLGSGTLLGLGEVSWRVYPAQSRHDSLGGFLPVTRARVERERTTFG